jgi:hypothetical protein
VAQGKEIGKEKVKETMTLLFELHYLASSAMLPFLKPPASQTAINRALMETRKHLYRMHAQRSYFMKMSLYERIIILSFPFLFFS